jgi:hypothetical protein
VLPPDVAAAAMRAKELNPRARAKKKRKKKQRKEIYVR